MEFQDRIAAPSPASGFAGSVGALRLVVGLTQGIFLYLLLEAAQTHSWPSTQALLFTPLVLMGLFKPPVVVSSLGYLSRRQLQLWAGTVAVTVAALGVYAVWRMGALASNIPAESTLPWAPLATVLVPWCFIAHALVMAGVTDRRRIASYPSYFEIAWKLIVQLAFSAVFVGALWLILLLGSQLFLLVQLSFLAELLHKPWFALPVTATAWTCAMHITDVRPAIVRGIRNLLLTLLSWILPVMTLLVGAFLLTLPFTGLAPLWATRHAAAVLLVAAGAFVVLINAAWQDGAALGEAPLAIRLSVRIASVLLVPVTAIAGYALALRVGAYGWTSERVVAAACVLVAACYSLGYASAALRDSALAAIARVNITAALVVLATVLALLSPLADPVRLAVNSQVARLESGKVAVDKFDFAWLRFAGQRFGENALARLDANASGPNAALLRQRIAEARRLKYRTSAAAEPGAPVDLVANVRVWPQGARLPENFLREQWRDVAPAPGYPTCLWQAGQMCDAVMLDLTGNGKVEILIVGEKPFSGGGVFGEDEQGHWRLLGSIPMELAGCPLHEVLKTGKLQVLAPTLNDVEVAGQRIHFESPHVPNTACPGQKNIPPGH